jgi:hypothetical protein
MEFMGEEYLQAQMKRRIVAPLSQMRRDFVRSSVMQEYLVFPAPGVFAGAGQRLCVFGAAALHEHREQGLLDRPGVLQLSAQVLCAV